MGTLLPLCCVGLKYCVNVDLAIWFLIFPIGCIGGENVWKFCVLFFVVLFWWSLWFSHLSLFVIVVFPVFGVYLCPVGSLCCVVLPVFHNLVRPCFQMINRCWGCCLFWFYCCWSIWILPLLWRCLQYFFQVCLSTSLLLFVRRSFSGFQYLQTSVSCIFPNGIPSNTLPFGFDLFW